MRSLEQYRTKVKKNEFRQRLGKTPVSVETPLLAGLLNTPVVIHATAIEFLASHSIAVVKFGLSEYGLYFRAICSTRNEFQALIGVCAEKYNIETEDIEDEKLMPAW